MRTGPIFWAGVLSLALLQTAWAAPVMTTTVTGTVDDPAATVTVNGIPALVFPAIVSGVVSGGAFTATGVPLEFGPNTITAVATDAAGNSATLAMTVQIRVRFNIQGTINELVVTLSVNSEPAVVNVTAGTFSASVPLALGLNTLTATATDAASNTGTAAIEVFVVRQPIDHP